MGDTMDSKQNGGDAFKNKYAGKYLPADVKNWSDKVEVRDAFTKRYADSYINLNAMDSKQDGGDAFKNKYAGKYLPADVKNWSDKVEVRDAFTKKYAGSYLPRGVKNWSNREEVRKDFENKYASEYTNLYAMKSDTNSDGAPVQYSESRSDAPKHSASAPRISIAVPNRPVEAQAATITASRESTDADAAMEMMSVPKQWALTASHASLITAVTLFVAGIAFLRATRKPRHQPVLKPLLDP